MTRFAQVRRIASAVRRAPAALRGHAREILHGVIHLWWIFVIVVPLTALGMWIAINYASDQSSKHTEKKFDQALIVVDRKFHQAIQISDAKHRQALHAQAVLFAYSINKSTCVLRTIATQQIDRLEATKLGNYKAAEKFWVQIIDNQVPIPAGFNCKSLPKKPPSPVAPSP